MVRNLLRGSRPQLVHSHGAHPDVVARLAARREWPLVSTVHGFTGGGLRNRLYEAAQVRALRGFTSVIPVSKPLAGNLATRGVASARMQVIPNAVRPAAFLPAAEARDALGVPRDGFLIGWVGRLSHEKAPDLFLQALGGLQGTDWSAVMVGDGPMLRGVMAGHPAHLATRVRLAGAVPGAARLLRAFDLLVLTSRTEGSPMILLEAMAAGVPIVATAVGGIPDMLTSDEAILVPPGESEAVQRGIQAAMADTDAAAGRAGRAAARAARDFSESRWIAEYERAYETALTRIQHQVP